MLIFKEKEIEEKTCTLKNYRGVRVEYDGEPMFFAIAYNLSSLVVIDHDGDFSSMPLTCAHWEDLWENILRDKYFYGEDEDDWAISEYFESFNIAITPKN